MDKEAYLRGGISMLRNRIISSVFFRLHLIERFGTGVKRIKEEYSDSKIKPSFDMTEDENRIYQLLKGREMSSSTISEAVGFGKNKTVDLLKSLVEKGYIKVSGRGRGTKYSQ